VPQPPPTPDAGSTAALRLLDQLQPAIQRGDRAKQVAIVRELLAVRAPMAEQWQQLADLALQVGELSLAREAIDRFVEAQGGSALAQFRKVGVLEQCGATAESYALLRSLPENVPEPAAHAYARGIAALHLGRIDEAREQLERLTQLRPDLGVAWIALATAFDLARETELAERIFAAESHMAGAAPAHRAAYYYALGKAHADRGDSAAAVAAFARGAREVKPLAPYSREADRRNAAESLHGYSAGNVSLLAREKTGPSARTIFVTGLPRSGTSLVEQILTSHSEVTDGGEVNRLLLLVMEIGGHSWPAVRRYADARGAAEAAALFDHWMRERFPAPGRLVDKSLTTTRLVGLAATLLPQAPLIWLTRDLLDCAWSCFRTFFQGTNPWSHDLEDLAFHFRIEDELLRQWQDILGDRLLVVPYEALVTEPETWIRRILAHCGLAKEPQAFAPHESDRIVRTASMMQVRRPIGRGAIGSAEPYREFMQPFVAAYRD
jgi:tetratricopeptide (TPR) repeat protein